MPRPTRLAPLLKRLRKARGLTQAQLAERSGYSTGMVTNIETGERNPSADTLLKIADALEATDAERSALEAARRADKEEGTRKGEVPRDTEETLDLSGLSAHDRAFMRRIADGLRVTPGE